MKSLDLPCGKLKLKRDDSLKMIYFPNPHLQPLNAGLTIATPLSTFPDENGHLSAVVVAVHPRCRVGLFTLDGAIELAGAQVHRGARADQRSYEV